MQCYISLLLSPVSTSSPLQLQTDQNSLKDYFAQTKMETIAKKTILEICHNDCKKILVQVIADIIPLDQQWHKAIKQEAESKTTANLALTNTDISWDKFFF